MTIWMRNKYIKYNLKVAFTKIKLKTFCETYLEILLTFYLKRFQLEPTTNSLKIINFEWIFIEVSLDTYLFI